MKKSFVWKYFINVSENKAECITCSKILSNARGSTSSLINHVASHLKRNEQMKFFDAFSQQKLQEELEITKRSMTNNSVGSTGVIKTTKTLIDFLKPTIQEIIARFAAVDGFSFNQIINSSATIGYLKSLNYDAPTSKTTIRKYVLEFANECKQKLISMLSLLKKEWKFTIILAEWTCVSCKRYLNINIFCNEKNYNLGLFLITGSANADNLFNTTVDALASFNIDFYNDVIAVTTDGVSVLKSAFREKIYFHQLCLNHAIHLTITDLLYVKRTNVAEELSDDKSLGSIDINVEEIIIDNNNEEEYVLSDEKIKSTVNKIRVIVKKFRKSAVKLDLLMKNTEETLGKKLKLILDVKTRWNSLYAMCERYLTMSSVVTKTLDTLGESGNDLTSDEIHICEELVKTLSPLTTTVFNLSDAKCTMYKAFLGFRLLFNRLESLESDFAKKVKENLCLRYEQREIQSLLYMTIYLNDFTVFEKLFNTSDFLNTIQTTRNEIEHLYYNYIDRCTDLSSTTQTTSLYLYDENTSFEQEWSKLCDKKQKRETHDTNTLPEEFEAYEKNNILGVKLQTVQRWINNIVPTSTESERVFSVSGNIKTKIRNLIEDDTLSALVFLKYWFKNK